MNRSIAVGAVAASVVAGSLLLAAPASAHTYDHKDPYRTGCDDDKRVVRSGDLVDRHGNQGGVIKLMWSDYCETNWTEIWVPERASGTIWVRTDRNIANPDDRFDFKPGNGGHHWGDMMWAPNVCAHGSATTSTPALQGRTSSACG